MGTPRIFTTAPSRLIADNELTALEMRVLLVVALHDGMSGVKGKGGGCYARHSNLAKLCRTDTTRFSKAVSRLIRLGYLVREPQLMDKRRFTLRVVYDEDDSWRTGLLSDGEIVDAVDLERATLLLLEGFAERFGLGVELLELLGGVGAELVLVVDLQRVACLMPRRVTSGLCFKVVDLVEELLALGQTLKDGRLGRC